MKNLNCIKIFATAPSFIKVQDLESTIAYCQTVLFFLLFLFFIAVAKCIILVLMGGMHCAPHALWLMPSAEGDALLLLPAQTLEVPSSTCWRVPKE